MDIYYDLIFEGQITADCSPKDARRNLARLLQQEPVAIEPLFSGKPHALRRNLDAKTAQRYQASLKQAGLVCRLAPVSDAIPVEAQPALSTTSNAPSLDKKPSGKLELLPTDNELSAQQSTTSSDKPKSTILNKCPKCGYQAHSPDDPLLTKYNGLGECPSCGIIPKKYLELQQIHQSGAVTKTQQTVDSEETIESENVDEEPLAITLIERRRAQILSGLISINAFLYLAVIFSYGMGVTDRDIAFGISLVIGIVSEIKARNFFLSEKGIHWLDRYGILLTINLAFIIPLVLWYLWVNFFKSDQISCTPSNFSEHMLGCEPLDQQKVEAAMMQRVVSRLSPTQLLGQLVELQREYHRRSQSYASSSMELIELAAETTPNLSSQDFSLLIRMEAMRRLQLHSTVSGFEIRLRHEGKWYIATENGYQGTQSE